MARIKIKDLNVNLEELKKKDPEILKKIRGGSFCYNNSQTPLINKGGAASGACSGSFLIPINNSPWVIGC
jgi:hypothetical protein